MTTENRVLDLTSFYNAPNTALFDAKTIANIRGCSIATLDRDRWIGQGIPFIKINRSVRYRKSDVLAWLDQFQPQQSTSQA